MQPLKKASKEKKNYRAIPLYHVLEKLVHETRNTQFRQPYLQNKVFHIPSFIIFLFLIYQRPYVEYLWSNRSYVKPELTETQRLAISLLPTLEWKPPTVFSGKTNNNIWSLVYNVMYYLLKTIRENNMRSRCWRRNVSEICIFDESERRGKNHPASSRDKGNTEV